MLLSWRLLCGVLIYLVVNISAAPTSPTVSEKSSSSESAEIASQIVQQLQSLGNHKLPGHAARSAVALQSMPSSSHYESVNSVSAASYYDPYSQDYVVQGPEPTQDPSLTPSGININGALGFISYLVLLVLLQSAVEGVAARSTSHRRKRDTRATEDLVGRALDSLDIVTTLGDLSVPPSDLNMDTNHSTMDLLSLLPSPVLSTIKNYALKSATDQNKARIERVERKHRYS